MKHLVTSGCSFTHANAKQHKGNKSWAYHLKDVIDEKNIGDFKLSNLGLSGVGNFTISLNCINKVETLLNDGVNPKDIVVFLQWTGLFRPTIYSESNKERIVPFGDSLTDYELKEIFKKHPYGFTDTAARTEDWFWMNYYENYYTTPAAFIDNLNNILKTQWYLKSKGIKYKMFNAWDIFTTADGSNGRFVSDKMLRPNQFSNGEYSNIDNVLLSDMYPISNVFWKMLDFDNYWFFNNDIVGYGGMIQWIQNNVEFDDWYRGFPTDVHPSNVSGRKFSEHVVVPLLIEMIENS